jgi:RNA polymerase sigma factor (TIGR02999 family)
MARQPSPQITRLLEAIHKGDRGAAEDLFTLVYDELRRMARARMARERAGHTLQPTALVHEVYVRLMAGEGAHFENRAHFFSAAAEAMRRILIEHARKKFSEKRQGARRKIELEETMAIQEPPEDELLALDEALTRLESRDRVMTDVLKLRFFVGLTVPETAEALGISPRTVDRNWTAARAWLTREITRGRQSPVKQKPEH